ncbi:MAG: hypothetical protein H0X50_05605 [Nitrosopumilus sp.]|nr:hypothetical protein [Nitrosopumilus sp.]
MTLASLGNNNTEANTGALENKPVNYHENTTGYLVYPSPNPTNQEKKLPAIVMLHENKGLNDYIKDSADILLPSKDMLYWQLISFKGKLPLIRIGQGY